MRTDSTQASPVAAPSAASAAFQVAVVQQKQFEETLERVNEKQTEAVKDQLRKAERKEDVVDIKGDVDKVLESSQSEQSSRDNDVAPDAEVVGGKVNVSV